MHRGNALLRFATQMVAKLAGNREI